MSTEQLTETLKLLIRGLDASRDALEGLGASGELLRRLDNVISDGESALYEWEK